MAHSGAAIPLRRNLSTSNTTFIGREQELMALTKMLTDPACRLLTLTGVGGIGKTQLAIQVWKRVESHFPDGAYWVDLQPMQSGDYLAPAIADAVGATLSGPEHLQQQLIHYLEPKHQLLVLDNFEHLIEHVDLLPEIIQHAPDVKLLVTSRETLNLQEEWLYPLAGLALPDSHETDGVEQYDGVRLFTERARQIRPDFSLTEERAGVIRICQLVEGMPLAIEMAAAWVKSLRCSAIAAEIQHNIHFLTSRSRNVPQRHHSMQAVFAQTWERLTREEQLAFKRLAIFRGGFQPSAAQAVAKASLPLLASLVDKNLLRCDDVGRYHLHELLRQYAESQLGPDEVHQIALEHCLYYADFLFQRQYGLVQGNQAETAIEIESELENIRMAWQTAVDEQQMDAIQKMAGMLFQFGQLRARYLETVGALDQALPILEARDDQRPFAQMLVYLAWMLIRVGKMERATHILEQSHSLFQSLDMTPAYGMGMHPLAPSIILQVVRGNYADAVQMGDQLVEEGVRLGDQHMLAFAYYGLSSAHFNMGNYQQAYQCAQQAVALSEEFGNRWFMAYCLNEWGSIACAIGDYVEADRHFRASYQIRQSFHDPEGIAVAIMHLGELALLRHDYSQAHELYEESLSIYQNLNDKGGLATVHHGLGQVAVQTSNINLAIHHLSQALTIATEIQYIPRMLSILIDIASLLLQFEHQTNQGIELLNVVWHHPSANQEQREHARELLGKQLESDLSQLPDLNNLALEIQIALMSLPTAVQAPALQPLVEPLTDREYEVLQLLGRGMLNTEIADQLVISIGTVKAHTSRIYGKLGVRNRVEAIAKARELSLLDTD